ncbi:hypothetical protein ANAPC1_00581 [Anaplasma phagocytophilum]|uniref:Uncharacterized protein n=1 Tax=Anaplasma phagocytophilum TaxID=948 RepID=A0AA45ZHE7_ANAPH|nr:hypothetical protein ANAPC1_00581 [Anaplasma phagocytophilum]
MFLLHLERCGCWSYSVREILMCMWSAHGLLNPRDVGGHCLLRVDKIKKATASLVV